MTIQIQAQELSYAVKELDGGKTMRLEDGDDLLADAMSGPPNVAIEFFSTYSLQAQ